MARSHTSGAGEPTAGATLEQAAIHVCMTVSALTSYQRRGIVPRYPPGQVDLAHVRWCVLRHLEMQAERRRAGDYEG